MTTALVWSDALALHQPTLDRGHREIIEALNHLDDVQDSPAQAIEGLDVLQALFRAHFAIEEGWMRDCRFEPENCHARQHRMVLELLTEVRQRAAEQADFEPLRRLLPALAEWLPEHAEAMDGALIYTMQQLGYEPEQGQALPSESQTVQGCGLRCGA